MTEPEDLARYIRTTVTTDPVERWWLDSVRVVLASLRSKDAESAAKDARIKELEGALRPFANVPAIGKHGGRFVIAHAVYDDMKRPGDCAPRQCYWHLDQFDRARSTLNPETAPSPDSKP